MSNLNKWNKWYENLPERAPYGDSQTYRIGAEFLKDCKTIEDWGCGKGWFSKFVNSESTYVGIDGSHNQFVDKQVDLEKYTSSVDGVFLRHVLEHNYNWASILENALKSFNKKMVLAIFTPWSDTVTKQIAFVESVGVPDISFLKTDIEEKLNNYVFSYMEIPSEETYYGVEYVYLISANQ